MPDSADFETRVPPQPTHVSPEQSMETIDHKAAQGCDRFLNARMAVGFCLYGLFALTFSYFRVKGDGVVYFNLLRKLFGEEPDFAYAYQFGSAVWNAPFFLVGKSLGILFGFQPEIFHVSFEEISITFAANAAFVLTLYLGWRILRELGLPRGPGVLFLTTFGTPLFFAVVFDPSGKHAVDTLVLTAAVFVFLRFDAWPSPRAAVVLGALCGWSLNIRWANAAFFLALAAALYLRGRRRDTGIASASAVAAGALILAVPAVQGIPYYFPIISQPVNAEATRIAAPPAGLLLTVAPPEREPQGYFDPTIPARMLFSQHRGLFLWTPLTAVAVIGFALAFLRFRRTGEPHASFLATLLTGSLALLCIHVVWARWDGGFAFSQRFLTALFPLFLIGVAELVRRAGFWAYPALVLAAAFSVGLALVRDVGYDGISRDNGVARVLDAGLENRHNMRLDVQNDAKARWEYLWSLLHSRLEVRQRALGHNEVLSPPAPRGYACVDEKNAYPTSVFAPREPLPEVAASLIH